MAKKDYIVGSGNVFQDLRYPRSAEALAKAELARERLASRVFYLASPYSSDQCDDYVPGAFVRVPGRFGVLAAVYFAETPVVTAPAPIGENARLA